MLLTAERTDLAPRDFVARQGDIFAVFGANTQDSGNISYGVAAGKQRYFVKTPGMPNDPRPFLSHADRVALLRNAVRLARSISHATLPSLRNVVESAEGPLLVYDWAAGDLIATVGSRRADPATAFARFRALPEARAVAALDQVFGLHVELARRGWIACDFYDGCILYDFAAGRVHVVDLDHYADAPFRNTMGRMFGSTRFMAPEEFAKGALIDERTTVFNLGRSIQQWMPSARAAVAAVAGQACRAHPDDRYQTVADFYAAWDGAVGPAATG